MQTNLTNELCPTNRTPTGNRICQLYAPSVERLTARYERQEDLLWRAFVEESPDIHAAGRSLSAVQDQLRSTLVEHGYDTSEVLDRVELPPGSRDIVESAAEARRVAGDATERSATLTLQAARALVNDGLSLRDVATVLGLSHTRVQQLLREPTDGVKGPEA